MSLTYHIVLRDLEDSRSQLRGVSLPMGGGEILDWLRDRRELEVWAADAACEEFALSLRWPSMQVESVAAQVHLRVGAAIAVCRHLAHRPVPDGANRRQVLRSLLLEYWHDRTRKLLQWRTLQGNGGPIAGGEEPPPHGPSPDTGFNVTLA